MSGNWDDTDSEDENVEVGNPVVIPRARQPSIARSLEKAGVQILENPLPGSERNEESDGDDSISIGSGADSEDFVDHSGEVIELDFDSTSNMKKMISLFPCTQRNIISEFADVEIFIISLDSLIIECIEHKYHNWTLAGQTIVLATQLDRFLTNLADLGGRFKLVVFTDLAAHFSRDTTLSFARSTALAHIANGPFSRDLEFFHSPLDSRWARFISEITPSFIMISPENVKCGSDPSAVEVELATQLHTVALDALSHAVPIVPLSEMHVNFADVTAFFIEPKLVKYHNWESYCAAHWDCNSEALRAAQTPTVDVSDCSSAAALWARIITEAKISVEGAGANLDTLAAAVLLSSLVCTRRGPRRLYLPERNDVRHGLDFVKDRRLLLNTASNLLEKIDYKTVKFPMNDFWDGRMVMSIFDEIMSNEPVLPYRLQEEMASLHSVASLSKSLAVDTSERLFEEVPENEDPLKKLQQLFPISSELLDQLAPELKSAEAAEIVDDGRVQDFESWFREKYSWRFKEIEEEYAKPPEKIENEWQLKKANKMKQLLSRWYEMFANSLEGRGSNLLVDFSRTPRGFAMNEEEKKDDKGKGGKGGKGGWSGQKAGGGGGKAAGGGSRKDQILEANKNAKSAKIVESEKQKIKFAVQQGKNAIAFLENLLPTLELAESRALCDFERTVRVGKELYSRLTGKENMDSRRLEGIRLVGLLKSCLVKHWQFLEERQRDEIVDLWVSLGFDAPEGRKASSEARTKKLDLGMNMVYYQMEYAGALVDIQSDPQKDDRVTGFSPDAWQRKMLDAVDLGNSALIIAPTSAGKTFVSYYCIEKVLRASDDDVVVYVSPSKALTNQVCGSIYARFRNKTLARGRSLFGTLTNEYGVNTLNCQVLVTIPESLENLLLSTNPAIQQFCSRIKYVIFDEVHSIGASTVFESSRDATMWEHLLLFISCPFLALSATINNPGSLHGWLDAAEKKKSHGKRKVELIHYGERYSELELAIQRIAPPQSGADEANGQNVAENGDLIQQFMPYGVYLPEKIRMFGIPPDQQLTARQILQLYNTMSSVDPETQKELEPCSFFGYSTGKSVWLNRSGLRRLEEALKKKVLHWLSTDEAKMKAVIDKLGGAVNEQMKLRSFPFNKLEVAVANIVPLIDEMRQKQMLPAICFNDDRFVCEELAKKLCEELENRQRDFEESPEFKAKFALKEEEKLLKLAKRKRDAKEKKGGKKGEKEDDGGPEREPEDSLDQADPLAIHRSKIKAALAHFKLRGRSGVADEDVYEKVVERMQRGGGKGKESTKMLLRMFERGIGFHHAGLNMTERGAVEILFRSGHLAIIFSTSTLALGMNMPCKTVIFGVDTPMLTPLLFRQMSGRAGRRGFDHAGTVVFLSVPSSKVRRLLTASLSTLQGNAPFTTTFMLRLLAYVNQRITVYDERSGAPVSTQQQRAEAALTLLTNSFSLFTRREGKDGSLTRQLRLYVAFSVQLLRHLQLLDKNLAATGMWQLAVALQGAEPGNLLFVYLLQRRVFHSICKEATGENLKKKMLMLLATIFTRVRLPPSYRPEDKGSFPNAANCSVFLDPLPKGVRQQADAYNSAVLSLFRNFVTAASSSKSLVDDKFSVSGQSDETVSLSNEYLVSPLFDGFSPDSSFLPIINFDECDHRGRKLFYNAYVVDFWVHESRKKLEQVNRLVTAHMWFQIHDFVTLLNRLSEALSVVARPQDPFCELMKQLAHEYDYKFRTAFGMKMKN